MCARAEHLVDLKTGAILSAEIHQATESDSGTLEASLRTAQSHLKEAGTHRYIEEVAADKGYHKGEALQACGLLNGEGIRTYVPEPESKDNRNWKGQESARVEGRRAQPSSDEAPFGQGTAAETERGGGADVCSHVCDRSGKTDVASRPGIGEETLPAYGGTKQPGSGDAKAVGKRQTEDVGDAGAGVFVPVERPESAPHEPAAPRRSTTRLPDTNSPPTPCRTSLSSAPRNWLAAGDFNGQQVHKRCTDSTLVDRRVDVESYGSCLVLSLASNSERSER